jgi:hypothetical protein
MEEPRSKKVEGGERMMRGRNDNEEKREEEEEEGTTPVRRESGPQHSLWPFSFSPLSSTPTNDLEPHPAATACIVTTACIATTATAYPTTPATAKYDAGIVPHEVNDDEGMQRNAGLEGSRATTLPLLPWAMRCTVAVKYSSPKRRRRGEYQRRWHDNDMVNMTPEWRIRGGSRERDGEAENATRRWRTRRGGGEDEEVEKPRRWRRQGGGEHRNGVENATGWKVPWRFEPPEGIVKGTRSTHQTPPPLRLCTGYIYFLFSSNYKQPKEG